MLQRKQMPPGTEHQSEACNKQHIPDSEPRAHGFCEVKAEYPHIETAAVKPAVAGHVNRYKDKENGHKEHGDECRGTHLTSNEQRETNHKLQRRNHQCCICDKGLGKDIIPCYHPSEGLGINDLERAGKNQHRTEEYADHHGEPVPIQHAADGPLDAAFAAHLFTPLHRIFTQLPLRKSLLNNIYISAIAPIQE